jgi:putative membrane protein
VYILFRVLVNALAIAVVARLLPGITVVNNDLGSYIIIGLVFGIVNALLKPLIALLTCSLVILTLGLFILIINGLMLWITAGLLPDMLTIDTFWWAVLGGVIISLINMALESAARGNDKDVTITIDQR